MPRPPRIDFPDAVYHVTSRGNGRARIFHSDDDRGRFLAQLAHHLHLCAVDLYAFVLMDNHFHLLCRTPRANLSRFMQRLLSSYALYWRYKHRRPGHLFQGRFRAKLVEDEVYGIDPALFSAHGRRVGAAKSVAVELAAQLADLSGRAIGEHYGMCATAVGASRRRLATRPKVLQVIEILGRKLRK